MMIILHDRYGGIINSEAQGQVFHMKISLVGVSWSAAQFILGFSSEKCCGCPCWPFCVFCWWLGMFGHSLVGCEGILVFWLKLWQVCSEYFDLCIFIELLPPHKKRKNRCRCWPLRWGVPLTPSTHKPTNWLKDGNSLEIKIFFPLASPNIYLTLLCPAFPQKLCVFCSEIQIHGGTRPYYAFVYKIWINNLTKKFFSFRDS